MSERLEVTKTYKLYIDGGFPRSESGRTVALRTGEHVCRASRKDLRDAVTAARKALPGWKNATGYLRGQILYRMAEMLEGRREEFAAKLTRESSGRKGSAPGSKGGAAGPDKEAAAAIDRLASFAGWADKYQQVLGCQNPVAGPYYNFTAPEPLGVVGVVAPDRPALLGLVSLIAPALCVGNCVVAVGGESDEALLAAALLGEVCVVSDLPPGVVNLLTGKREDLVPAMASHRDIDGVHGADLPVDDVRILREGAAENLKRVTTRSDVEWFDTDDCHGPGWIEPLVEMKTVWHPSAS